MERLGYDKGILIRSMMICVIGVCDRWSRFTSDCSGYGFRTLSLLCKKDLLWWLCYVPVGFSLDWVHWLVYGVICKSSEVSFKTSVLGSWYLMECAKDELITWRDEHDFENHTSSFWSC